jgi:hypothetical protein
VGAGQAGKAAHWGMNMVVSGDIVVIVFSTKLIDR